MLHGAQNFRAAGTEVVVPDSVLTLINDIHIALAHQRSNLLRLLVGEASVNQRLIMNQNMLPAGADIAIKRDGAYGGNKMRIGAASVDKAQAALFLRPQDSVFC